MFEDLRRAFREAVDNFRDELNRDDVPENVDRLLKGMIDEVTEAKARLADLENQLDKTGQVLERHQKELDTTLRRKKMALEIDDEETAQVASDYATKLEQRVGILVRKSEVLGEETRLQRAEVESMMSQLKDARAKRDGLTAQAGRTGARESIGGSRDLFDEFDRMESEITGEEATADAYADVGRATSEYSIDFDESPREPDVDFDARLEELKRRMRED